MTRKKMFFGLDGISVVRELAQTEGSWVDPGQGQVSWLQASSLSP